MSLWGNQNTDQSVPKYLTPAQVPFAVFIDETEAKNPVNISKGLNSPGWWLYKETKDSAGNIRHRAEHLICLRSPVADTGTGIREAIVDTIEVPTTAVLSFTTKPSNQTVVAPAPATFSTVVAVSPVGGAISYQWLLLDPATKAYNPLTDAGVYTGTTTNALTISDSTGLNGTVYKVVASAPNAVDITSVAVKLIVS